MKANLAQNLSQSRVLIVDDEAINLKLLAEILKGKAELSFAKSGKEALNLVESLRPDLVLLDIMMPDMDGYQVAEHIKSQQEYSDIPIIFITALNDDQDELKGLQMGAVDYITKPLNPPVVEARLLTHLQLSFLHKKLIYQNEELDQKVAERTRDLLQSQKEIIQRLGRAAEYRDPETGDHLQRMSHYTAILAKHYGMGEMECELLQHAATMHDIGKVGTPDEILLKNAKLTNEEFEVMKQHTIIGEEILGGSRYDILMVAKNICSTHHEKWNGTGYPRGLKGKEIPLEGRLAAVADVFDALLSRRTYKEAWTVEGAVDLIKSEAGRHFDPDIVKVFDAALPELLEIHKKYPH